MPQQLDLTGAQPLKISPAAGLTEPRLWIRRLVIWSEPRGEKIRDIALRPGLNIIWSPDRADDEASAIQSDSIGHGSGKTLFCRLIRYCLGEDHFATEAQRGQIGAAFLNGIVGAEVILDGTCWAITRPLGVRRRHMAVANGNLDEIAGGDGASTGIEPFINAVDQSMIASALGDLVRIRSDGPNWPVALAWLTRDQECRFDNVLDWRSPASDSNSPMPASGREKGPRLEALRALLMAITPDEQMTRAKSSSLDEQRRTLEQEITHRRWEIERVQDRLISTLGLTDQTLPEMPLLLDLMRRAATQRVAAVSQLPVGRKAELVAARKRLEEARSEWAQLDRERIRLETSLPIEERVLSEIKGELPGLSYSVIGAGNPVCPICEVPIDRALAEQCKLSHKLHDTETCRARWESKKLDAKEQEKTLTTLRQKKPQLLRDLALAKQTLDQCSANVAAIEAVRDSRESSWYSARRLEDDVERLVDIYNTKEAAAIDLQKLTKTLETERNRLGAFRNKQARTFGKMSDTFDPIIRRLLGHNAKSRITLTGGGVELAVDMGGDRTTAAIDSLKVLSFDLAAMCLSIEGAACIPAFLLHDSPREADLGLSIYHELFRLIREIEQQTDQPLFQYIITSTTRPPRDLTKEPWLRLTLRGSPPHERLLRADL